MSEVEATKAALRKAAGIIQRLERRVEELERGQHEPIAIIGVGCRLPGGVSDLPSLHALLMTGADTVGPMRLDRFWLRPEHRTQQDLTGGVRGASFIDGLEDFDADFWGIPEREATLMDPQQRLLLECAWEALEHARCPASGLRGRRVGVFVAPGTNDYAERVHIDRDEPDDAFKARLGASFSAGRISFLLGLQGPALAVEAACASSLVAIHLACQSLRSGESELALAGGAQALLSPDPFLILSKVGGLTSDGRCRSFSAQATGYGRGEGCGVLVMKRLADATAAGDRVLGVIRGSAVNHDGPRSSLTAPNGTAQRALLRQALHDARVEPSQVDYVEAHAIGTSLGDVIEVEAIAEVYGAGRREALRMGSSKSTFGHLEPASGVTAVLKVLALLQHEVLSPNSFTEQLNPHLDWARLPVRVVRAPEAWPRSERLRRAGVSAFGLSGTNAHAVLEEAPAPPTTEPVSVRPAELVLLSARSPAALSAAAARLSTYLAQHDELTLAEVAYTLGCTRTLLPWRLAIPAASRPELEGCLQSLARGETPAGVSRGDPSKGTDASTWLFPASAGDLLPSAPELCRDWPVFGAAFEAALRALEVQLPRPLRPADALSVTELSAPAAWALSFAWQHAASALWRSFGVSPNALVGQGLGQLAAACAAGVLELTAAARLLGAWHVAGEPDPRDRERRLSEVARAIELRPPQVELFSGSSGERVGAEVATASYWVKLLGGEHERAGALRLPRAAAAKACLSFGRASADEARGVRPVLLTGDSATQRLLAALGHWVAEGGAVDGRSVWGAGRAVDLPLYAWQRRRYWVAGER